MKYHQGDGVLQFLWLIATDRRSCSYQHIVIIFHPYQSNPLALATKKSRSHGDDDGGSFVHVCNISADHAADIIIKKIFRVEFLMNANCMF